MKNSSDQKVWFIAGTSTGFGSHLTRLVLSLGDKVVATSRTPEKVKGVFSGNENLLSLKMDVTDDNDVKRGVDEAIRKFGKLDVVVSNAGYVLVGSIEELSDREFRDTLNVNLFGTVNVLRAVLPHLRKQGHGHIINIASNAGYAGMPNAGSYNASKFAIVGISEALQKEIEPFGVKVTAIAPGQFRTNLWGGDAIKHPGNPVPEYNSGKLLETLSKGSGKQPGDPDKLAKVITDLVKMEKPPVHLMLGKDTYYMVTKKRGEEAAEFGKWKEITLSTDFDDLDDQPPAGK